MPEMNNRPVIYFDGICNLCNDTVQFIIEHDKQAVFLFASLQSEQGQTALNSTSTLSHAPDSIILFEKGKYYMQSTAALSIARHLNGLWPVLYTLIIIPPFIRNGIYNLIARNRYKWFGKKNECMMPTPALKDRFL